MPVSVKIIKFWYLQNNVAPVFYRTHQGNTLRKMKSNIIIIKCLLVTAQNLINCTAVQKQLFPKHKQL